MVYLIENSVKKASKSNSVKRFNKKYINVTQNSKLISFLIDLNINHYKNRLKTRDHEKQNNVGIEWLYI